MSEEDEGAHGNGNVGAAANAGGGSSQNWQGTASKAFFPNVTSTMSLHQASSMVLHRVSSTMLLRSLTSSFPNLSSIVRFTGAQPRFAVDNRTCPSVTLAQQNTGNFCSEQISCFADGILGKQDAPELEHGKSHLLFLGTGTSEGIPRVSCLTNSETKCSVCWSAVCHGSKNRRRNTSILIRLSTASGIRNILIDVGKFFYHSALQWFPSFGYVYTHSLLLLFVVYLQTSIINFQQHHHRN
ncbi:hypothetical protein L7F22_028158 [Adiantum nelumboides]|nr:hypothetical protein [Adiantum nelumboides]